MKTAVTHIKAMSAVAAVLGAISATPAMAIPTNVQLNWNGVAGFDTTGINEFDWQSSGDLVVVDLLPVAATYLTPGGPVSTTSFSAWAAGVNANPLLNAGVSGIQFNINAQARLNDMLNTGGNSIAPTQLNTSGSGAGFEITGTLSATETAIFAGFGILSFQSISGTYNWYLDSTPDSNVAAGTGFTDSDTGLPFLTGNTVGSSGAFVFGAGGNVLVRNTVTSYDSNIIQTDPASNAPLIGTTFDTLISLVSAAPVPNDNGHEAAASDVGDLIGNAPGHVVVAGDQGFKADANSEFSSVPEPATLFLLGSGLLGMAGMSRRKRNA